MELTSQSQWDRRGARPKASLPIDRFDAFIFDMDGVVTDSAVVHEHCWKGVFDDFLRGRSERDEEDLRPFDEDDYLRYVDGKPRYDGVASFLTARRITLEPGAPSDPPGIDTVCALGNLKDRDFEQRVAEEGVTVFDSTVSFLRSLRSYGIKTALISSSRHARVLLVAAQITGLFDVVVDGIDSEALELPGKPDPAIFLTAAKGLEVVPARSVVVEDAEAGVEAGRRGGFGFVLGIDRVAHADALRLHGASAVVNDLRDVELQFDDAAGQP
jgi:alpha,alpha-trehalase